MSKICTGDIRKELAKDLKRKVGQAIAENLDKYEYYIFVFSQWSGNALSTNLFIVSVGRGQLLADLKPLGTMLIHVNNREGRAKLIYSLPLDIPLPDEILSKDSVEQVFDIAKSQKLPIHYN